MERLRLRTAVVNSQDMRFLCGRCLHCQAWRHTFVYIFTRWLGCMYQFIGLIKLLICSRAMSPRVLLFHFQGLLGIRSNSYSTRSSHSHHFVPSNPPVSNFLCCIVLCVIQHYFAPLFKIPDLSSSYLGTYLCPETLFLFTLDLSFPLFFCIFFYGASGELLYIVSEVKEESYFASMDASDVSGCINRRP